MAKKKRSPKKSETQQRRPAAEESEVTQPITDPIPEPSTSQASAVPVTASSPQPVITQSSEIKSEDLAKEVKQMFIAKTPQRRLFPKRPNYLTNGSDLSLLTNHFLLKVGRKMAFHYDIEIESVAKTPKKDKNIVDKEVEETNPTEKKKNQFSRKIATKLNRKIFEKMIAFYSRNGNRVFEGINPVYDGQKNMFTSKILNGTENRGILRLAVNLEDGRDTTFYVNIKLAETNAKIDLNILNVYHRGTTCDDEVVKKSILFINTLLRHNSSMSWIPIGQSIFDPQKGGQALEPRRPFLLLSYGSYSSVRNLMIGPTLNVDRSAAAFYDSKIPISILIGYIINGDFNRLPKLDDSERRKIKRELSGLQVEATHVQYGDSFRRYRILGITKDSAKDIKFEWNEKEREGEVVSHGLVSVVEYFRRKYRITVKYPQLPCFELGNPNNVVKIPLEMCRLVSHQRLRRSMTNTERSEMTRISGSQTPSQRMEECIHFVKNQFHVGDMAEKNKPFLLEFEINVDQNLMKVNSKVIPPPQLKYGPINSPSAKSVTPRDGEWEMFRTNARFLRPARLDNWIIINLSFESSFTPPQGDRTDDRNINCFVKDLLDQANEMGMPTADPITKVIIKRFITRTTFIGIKERLKTHFPKLKMILFITPDKGHEYSDDIYSEIKLLGDVERGLTTQCCNINSLWNPRNRNRPQKWNRSYLRQLMLKINPKLGGTNVALLPTSYMPPIFKKESNLMIIGADVNHPAPADRISPSIAALVGSYDNEFSNYYTTVSMQPKSREEMIKHLDQMAIELLENYKKKNNSLPQRIIFYRDGVSEGQFQHVIDNEHPLLTEAFSKMDAKYKPKLTFIVVQKRHHTRFMRADNKQNVPPGTVVEKDITHKTDFDFYLCSHAGRIGTSRSAHYYVLADENGFSSDDMCRMTYYLCHIYQRCTKSVSIPAPVYYADLAAYRAKVHASAYVGHSEVSSLSGDEAEERQIRSYQDQIKVLAEQKEKLYFC